MADNDGRRVGPGPGRQRAGDGPGQAARPCHTCAASDRAAVVNTCSIAATADSPAGAVFGQQGRGARAHPGEAADHLAEGIRVNCVNPGHGGHAVDRPAARRSAADPAAERAALEARQPSGRPSPRTEVAARDRVPRRPGRRLHHRHRPRRGRRDVRPAGTAPHVTGPHTAVPRHTDVATLGPSGVPVTRLGLGTAAIGGLFTPVGEEQAAGTLDAAGRPARATSTPHRTTAAGWRSAGSGRSSGTGRAAR